MESYSVVGVGSLVRAIEFIRAIDCFEGGWERGSHHFVGMCAGMAIACLCFALVVKWAVCSRPRDLAAFIYQLPAQRCYDLAPASCSLHSTR